MEKSELKKLAEEFNYELYYLEYFCEEFKSLQAAIAMIKKIIKDNPDCKGGYNIRLNHMIIAIF